MSIKVPKISHVVCVSQVLLIWSYLFLNIKNFGGGVEIRLLIVFFVVGLGVVIFENYPVFPRVGASLFVFFVLILWVALRYFWEKDDLADLMGVTVGTTGGILLFYLTGLVLRACLCVGLADFRVGFLFLVVFYFLFVVSITMYLLTQVRGDIFYIDTASGDYQRPGNFMSISFLIFSYVYVLDGVSSYLKGSSLVRNFALAAIYTASVIALLLSAQAIGSNSATAVILCVYVVSSSFTLSLRRNKLRSLFFWEKVSGFEFVKLLWEISKGLVLVGLFIVVGGAVLGLISNFDIMSTRVFNFGEGGNSSIDSRMDILWRTGVEQISYAPIFGSVDVAYHVTGDAGETLHNFLPDVWASLGVVGLLMVMLLFSVILCHLYRSATRLRKNKVLAGFLNRATSFYFILLILFIFLFANISVGFSWAVLWFLLGFVQSPLVPSWVIVDKEPGLVGGA